MKFELYIELAGIVHFAIACANFVAFRRFHYRESLAPAPEIVRQVFVVQNVFVVLTVIGLGVLCLVFPRDLAGSTALGRALSAFLAVFWGLRLALQLFYYSAAKRREYPVWDALFVIAFVYLAGVFSLAAIKGFF